MRENQLQLQRAYTNTPRYELAGEEGSDGDGEGEREAVRLTSA